MFVAPILLTFALAPAELKVLQPLRKPPPAVPAAVRQPILGIGGGKPLPVMPVMPVPPGTNSGRPPTIAVGGPGDENVLRTAKLNTTDTALLDFFRRRTPPAPTRDKISELVKQLNAPDPNDRDVAQGQLTAIGQPAVPVLRETANKIDEVEAARRARECLRNIEGNAGANLVINAARLLAARKPNDAAKVLMGYLPFAEDETTFQEIEAALVGVALKDGKPDPAILEALKDKLAIRRGAAAQVLCQAGDGKHLLAIRVLLKDPQPSVRLRAALGLVGAYDPEAIPVLIDLLADLSPRLRQQSEEYLVSLAGEWAVFGPKGNDLMSRRLRRDVWAAWWKNTDGATLLEEFRSRTIADEKYEEIAGLITKLGDANAETRDSAINDLVAIGEPAASQLRRAVNDNHPQISPLAARALDTIEKDVPSPLPTAAPRLLALRKPEGTVETLVAYLPFCESAETSEQLIDILATVGCPVGKADAALVKALESKVAARRAGAVVALCRGRATDQVETIRKLLKDKDLTVQLRAAQGLAMMGEKEAIPVLIGLLKELPIELVWDVEDYLTKVAGDKAPTEIVTADAASRGKAITAWTKWWKDNEKSIDLTRLDLRRRDLGLYLLVENYNPTLGRGRVIEVDATGKVRWEVRNLQWPNDAQLLRGGNVLVVEQQNRVTERDRTGKIVGFDRYYPSVFHVERLRDGNTFIACRNQLMIVDSKGATLFNHVYNINSILAAKRFRDGSMAYVSYSGHYVKLDRTGKQLKSFNLSWVNRSANGAEILPGDRVVLSDSRTNKVIEFDNTGKVAWECSIMYPLIPTGLSNGNVLVAGNSNQAIYEIDRKGKIVKEWKGFTFRPYRVFRR